MILCWQHQDPHPFIELNQRSDAACRSPLTQSSQTSGRKRYFWGCIPTWFCSSPASCWGESEWKRAYSGESEKGSSTLKRSQVVEEERTYSSPFERIARTLWSQFTVSSYKSSCNTLFQSRGYYVSSTELCFRKTSLGSTTHNFPSCFPLHTSLTTTSSTRPLWKQSRQQLEQ